MIYTIFFNFLLTDKFFLGPYAHLFHSTHEQNYVAHVIGYAAKMGPYAKSNALINCNLQISGIITLVTILIIHKIYF